MNKHNYKVGEKVILRGDVLLRHARSVPAHMGYTHEQFQWRDILNKKEGKIGTITRIFPDSNHVNVTYRDGNVIGIEASEVIRVPSTSKNTRKKNIYSSGGITKAQIRRLGL